MTQLNLLVDGHPSNAAILLFGRKPQAFFRTATVKCQRSPGGEKSKRPTSSKVFKGTVFHLVDETLDFTLSSASGGNQFEIPVDVVREAIVNSVAHRDYTTSANIEVSVFDDRLEIWNPGTPPPSLTIDALRRPHDSLPRNPLIAKCLYLARYSERIGTGTRDMIMTTRGVGLPVPQFAIRNNGFLISLFRR